MEDTHRRFDDLMLGLDRRHLHHRVAHGPAEPLQSARRLERIVGRAHDFLVQALGGARHPDDCPVLELGLLRIKLQPTARDGHRVVVQQPCAQQFVDHVPQTACSMEMVHIGQTIGIDARQQGRHLGDIREILPVENDPPCPRHRHQMDKKVGGAACGVEPDNPVHESLFGQDIANRGIIVAQIGHRQSATRSRLRQRIAQLRVRRHEAGARQVQPHEFHQHLVGVGRAIECAGARPVISPHFGGHQLFAPDFAGGELLADKAFFVVGNTRGHRPGRQKDGRDMSEGLRRDNQSRHDLVADTKIDGGVKGVVAHGNARRHCDDIARKKAKFHPWLALGDTIAHRGHPACNLRGAACFSRRRADQFGKTLERLVRRQHVIVGRHDAEVAGALMRKLGLVGPGPGIGMRLPRTAKMRACGPFDPRRLHTLQIVVPGSRTAIDNALRDPFYGFIQ